MTFPRCTGRRKSGNYMESSRVYCSDYYGMYYGMKKGLTVC